MRLRPPVFPFTLILPALAAATISLGWLARAQSATPTVVDPNLAVSTVVAGPPPGISPCPSARTQRPPSDRTLSDPLDLDGGWPGSIVASASYVHSPTSCWSH